MARKRNIPAQGTSATFEGELLGLTPRGLEGWVRSPAVPGSAVTIEVRLGGAAVGSFVADRSDVPPSVKIPAARGHGFLVQLQQAPRGIGLPALLEVLVSNTGFLLGSTTVASHEQLGWALKSYCIGHADAIEHGRLVGWAVDMKSPEVPLQVELLDNGEVVGEAECSGYRADVRSSGIGDGRCGFSLPLPATILDGKVHALTVRLRNGWAELEGSPLLFGPSSYSGLVQQVTRLDAAVTRLDSQVRALMPRGEAYQKMERLLLDRYEALLAIHREGVEGELSALRRMLFGGNDAPSAPKPQPGAVQITAHDAPQASPRARRKSRAR